MATLQDMLLQNIISDQQLAPTTSGALQSSPTSLGPVFNTQVSSQQSPSGVTMTPTSAGGNILDTLLNSVISGISGRGSQEIMDFFMPPASKRDQFEVLGSTPMGEKQLTLMNMLMKMFQDQQGFANAPGAVSPEAAGQQIRGPLENILGDRRDAAFDQAQAIQAMAGASRGASAGRQLGEIQRDVFERPFNDAIAQQVMQQSQFNATNELARRKFGLDPLKTAAGIQGEKRDILKFEDDTLMRQLLAQMGGLGGSGGGGVGGGLGGAIGGGITDLIKSVFGGGEGVGAIAGAGAAKSVSELFSAMPGLANMPSETLAQLAQSFESATLPATQAAGGAKDAASMANLLRQGETGSILSAFETQMAAGPGTLAMSLAKALEAAGFIVAPGGAAAFAPLLAAMGPFALIASLPMLGNLLQGGRPATPGEHGKTNLEQGAALLGVAGVQAGNPEIGKSFEPLNTALRDKIGEAKFKQYMEAQAAGASPEQAALSIAPLPTDLAGLQERASLLKQYNIPLPLQLSEALLAFDEGMFD